MMNYLWGGMIVIGIVFGIFTGNIETITNAALESAQAAVTLCITMIGVMSMWVGLMEIAREAGIMEFLSKIIRPFLFFLFPNVPSGSKAEEYISVNVIANILGLGWAATPAGLSAMEELEKLREQRREPEGIATDEMCNFLILNISSLQLIPVNMIAYRSQYGSASPTAIIGPAILATTFSTLAGIIIIKLYSTKRKGGGV